MSIVLHIIIVLSLYLIIGLFISETVLFYYDYRHDKDPKDFILDAFFDRYNQEDLFFIWILWPFFIIVNVFLAITKKILVSFAWLASKLASALERIF